jgi:hypothetical protein
MKDKFTSLFAPSNTDRRDPTGVELASGIQCGPFDRAAFNEMFYRLSAVNAEIVNVITAAGITPSATVLTQLHDAIELLVAVGGRVHVGLADTGTVNAIAADVVPSVSAWVDGDIYVFAAGNTTTSVAPTFAPDGLAPKVIIHDDGTALVAGEGLAGAPLVAVYRAAVGKLVLIGCSKTYVDKAIASAAVQPYARGLLSATSIPTSTTTNLTIGAPDYASGITLASNRLVLPTAGRYLVTASAAITGVFTNGLITAARRSSVDALIDTSVFGAFGQDGSGTWGNCAGIYRVSAGDRVAFSLIQYSGGATTTAGVGAYSVTRIGD